MKDRTRFGQYGGRYVPEILMPALEELEREYDHVKGDSAFQAELLDYMRHYGGRPTPLYFARRLTERCGGAVQSWPCLRQWPEFGGGSDAHAHKRAGQG